MATMMVEYCEYSLDQIKVLRVQVQASKYQDFEADTSCEYYLPIVNILLIRSRSCSSQRLPKYWDLEAEAIVTCASWRLAAPILHQIGPSLKILQLLIAAGLDFSYFKGYPLKSHSSRGCCGQIGLAVLVAEQIWQKADLVVASVGMLGPQWMATQLH